MYCVCVCVVIVIMFMLGNEGCTLGILVVGCWIMAVGRKCGKYYELDIVCRKYY